MDIQKEREAFEAVTNIYHCIYSADLNYYFSGSQFVGNKAEIAVNAGWKAWQAAKAQAVPEWISVEDQMPPVDETVLVCWDYAPDIEPDKEYTTIDENLDEYWPNCQDEPPTHWMPLPEVIKAQEPAND